MLLVAFQLILELLDFYCQIVDDAAVVFGAAARLIFTKPGRDGEALVVWLIFC